MSQDFSDSNHQSLTPREKNFDDSFKLKNRVKLIIG